MPRRVPARSRTGACALAALALAPLLAGCGGDAAPDASCSVTVPGTGTLTLDLEQAASAGTIAQGAARAGLPHHAVTIALATAVQESKLRNLPYGDRDSLGLFQQRPSQGWGTAEQVQDPVHATAAFYARLEAVPDWEDLPVTVAAQAVQRSAYPEAYAAHEGAARGMARAYTGELPAAVACRDLPELPALDGDGLAAAAARELPRSRLQPTSEQDVWAAAAWLVPRAVRYGVREVTADGRRWTAATGTWADAPGAPPGLTCG